MLAAAVMVAQFAGGNQPVTAVCIGYLLWRLLYQRCYLLDGSTLRSVSWG